MYKMKATIKSYEFIYIYIICMMCVTPSVLACSTSQLGASQDGHVCVTGNYRNVSNILSHLCMHRCITAPDSCVAVSYNKRKHYCILVAEHCVVLGTDDDFVFTSVRPGCVDWIPFVHGEDFPSNAAISSGGRAAGRARLGDDVLVGNTYVSPDALVVRDLAVNNHHMNDYSVMVIDPACDHVWVPFIAGNPLPANAVAGGVAENRLVYVARSTGLGGYYGYYDAQTGLGYFGGFTNQQDMEILTLA